MKEKLCQRKIQQQFGIEFCNEENSFVIFEAQLINSSSVVRFRKNYLPHLAVKRNSIITDSVTYHESTEIF